VAAEQRAAFVADVSQDEHWFTVDGLDDWVRSALVVPLLVRDRLVGVLSLHSERLNAFDETQHQLVEVVAAPVAIAIQNAQLYHQVTRRVREQTLLNRISGGFGAALNVDSLTNCALEGLQELVAADRTYFVTTDPDACTWETTHELVAPGIEPDIGLHGAFDDVQAELEALLSGQPFAVSDIATDSRVEDMRETYRALGMQSMLLMPVQARGRLYGALGFDSCRERHVWQPDEIRLLEGVAHQLELALENVRLLEEARLRADELAIALAQQEELDCLKDEFIQNVSHELRSPLALVCGYAEMLDAGELGELQPEQQQPVAVITRRAHMLSDLVQDITLILETEVNPPEAEPIPLDELALAAVEAEIAPHLPPVSGSPIYLRRVLDNLIGNAAKFTPEGGTITVRLRQEGQWVALEVSDTGIGMPADKLERVFERFYQVDGSTKRKYGGVGLGLALVKEIVETCGGSVTVESQVGEGTTFTVLFPIAAGTEEIK
jgi:signal transduction histidine kinase